ncbi:SMC-Scp complex subunit ScpB [Candidatus Uhrbacteria bacterium RIFOXYB2_FULL_45_11]|uniref:SMC-Scp complex subunit ScpB n=1 Tax=Candidatus Uhrbacteria bacterium RIFOXYB2_FULL_45_11 TaxID=1802421 RepID=A0A1F7W6Q0_9BACT|nr:MAG: SMC-Scp complex subunit ScpB [Candidatus Uhrbacteria bacterium RIFOXYB2_FULL_45_11]
MLTTNIESILFAAAKPIALEQLRKYFDVSAEVVAEAVEDIRTRYNRETSGIHLLEQEGKVQFVTNPDASEDVASFLKKDATSPLTKPSLETLTVIAYRGPVTRPELEQIRGVNCGVILRNLLIRGFIEETQDRTRLQPVYSVSIDFMRKLGLTHLEELPEYESFHTNQSIDELLKTTPDESVV